jgi:hypothetical protein
MATISQTDARGLFTKKLMDVYQERIRPKSFLRSFFPSTFSPTKEVSIEVERGFEKVAVDVVRGSEGNYNRFTKSTEKIFVPPFWREYFTATDFDIYDLVLGARGTDNSQLFAELLNRVGDRLGLLQDMIERAKEIQCAEVLQTGIVTLVNGDNIDFKRKAASIVDLGAGGAGGYFATDSDLFAQFKSGCEFIRTKGKSGDFTYIAILGATAYEHLLANAKFKDRQNLFHMSLDQVMPPQIGTTGGAFHGTIVAGPYRVQLWTYPDFYDNASGVSTPYIGNKNIVIVPPKPRFRFAHALVPQLVDPGQTSAPQQGEWVYGEYLDQRKAKHDFDVQSAGLPVPVAVDQVYTMQAVA